MIYDPSTVKISLDGIPLKGFVEVPITIKRGIVYKDFTIETIGDTIFAEGDGWTYKKVGTYSEFKQTKKIPSLRAIKSLIKELQKI